MPEATKTKEQQAAEVLDKLSSLFEGDESLPTLMDKVKAMASDIDEFKELDLKAVCEEFDKLKARQDTVMRAIKTNHHSRGFVPGFEDIDTKQFSLVKAMSAIASKSWKNAGFEEEVIKEATAKAAQAVGDDTLGGYFIPDAVIPDVIEAIYTASAFVGLEGSGETNVSVLDGLGGVGVRIPKFDGGTLAYWVGEEDAIAESNVTTGDVTMNPKQLGVLVRLTDAMRRWQSFGFERLLRQDMVRAAAKKVDWTIAYGNGGNHMPLGLAHQNIKVYMAEDGTMYADRDAAVAGVSDSQGGELTFDGLDNMQLQLEEDDVDVEGSFRYVSAPRYFKRLKQTKVDHYTGQSTNQAYLIGPPVLTDAQLASLIGPFSKSNQIPSAQLPGASLGLATTDTAPGDNLYGDVFAGNLTEVLFGRWGGIEVSDDGGRGKDFASGHINMKLIMYCDIVARQLRALSICPDAKMR